MNLNHLKYLFILTLLLGIQTIYASILGQDKPCVSAEQEKTAQTILTLIEISSLYSDAIYSKILKQK